MKHVTKLAPFVYEPILPQRGYSLVSRLDPVLTNNLIARNILEADQVVPGRGRGTRLFTPFSAWEGRILNEAVTHHKMPLADAAKIAQAAGRLAREGKWVDNWARALSEGRHPVHAFMLVTWADDCYDAQIIAADNKTGGPDFSSQNAARFLAHPFMTIPVSNFFVDVWNKSKAMLAADQKA
jgi:hypothetical protein